MKKLLLLILFSSHFAWAEDTSNLIHRELPPLGVELMVKERFLIPFMRHSACFNYPKINVSRLVNK